MILGFELKTLAESVFLVNILRYVRLSQNSGLKVSAICLGTWFLPRRSERDEYGVPLVDIDETRNVLKKAWDLGINFIDTANRYHGAVAPVPLTHVGYAEKLLGRLIKELGFDREALVIATKVGNKMAERPNGEGLSRKHIFWQVKESLKRLGVEYIDIYYAHRYDPETPPLEVMSTMNDLVRKGFVLYIGMSNIPSYVLVEYQLIAERYGFEPISVLQYKYNWMEREVEQDIVPVAKKFGIGLTVYSPLARGLLTGKYVDIAMKKWVIPPGSRAEIDETLRKMFTQENLEKVVNFIEFAKSKNVTSTQLAIAWLLKRSEELGITIIPITSVSNTQQLEEIVEAVNVNLSSDDMKYLEELYRGLERR
jgi:aryl-alcohol dehydrogenase-like predicted oxidoreductase